MNTVRSFRSKLLVTIVLLAFAAGLAIFTLGFFYLTVCGCGDLPDVPPPASQIQDRKDQFAHSGVRPSYSGNFGYLSDSLPSFEL